MGAAWKSGKIDRVFWSAAVACMQTPEQQREPTRAHTRLLFSLVPSGTGGTLPGEHAATPRDYTKSLTCHTAPRPRLADRAFAVLQQRCPPRQPSSVSGLRRGHSRQRLSCRRCNRAVSGGAAVFAWDAACPLSFAAAAERKPDKVCFREPSRSFRLRAFDNSRGGIRGSRGAGERTVPIDGGQAVSSGRGWSRRPSTSQFRTENGGKQRYFEVHTPYDFWSSI